MRMGHLAGGCRRHPWPLSCGVPVLRAREGLSPTPGERLFVPEQFRSIFRDMRRDQWVLTIEEGSAGTLPSCLGGLGSCFAHIPSLLTI